MRSDTSNASGGENRGGDSAFLREEGVMMKRSLKDLLRVMLVFGGLCLVFTVKAQAGVEEYEYPHYVGVATATVNVREGAGVSFDQVTDASGKKIQLSTGDEVEILEERKADDGIIWYHIAFTQKGVDYIGFSTSSYLAKDGDRIITPAPTPTPVIEIEEEETVPVSDITDNEEPKTDSKKEKVTDPSETAETEAEDEDEGGSGIGTILFVVIIVACILFGFWVALNYLIKKKKDGQNNPASRKAEKFKQINMQKKDAGKRVPQIRQSGQRPAVPLEPRREVYVKRREPVQDNFVPVDAQEIEQDNESKKSLREKIEQLQEHDLVRHVVYGEGEVCDNSDVKLLEVRFGNDMRFLKKDQLVNKRELVVYDEDEQSIARRRNRRANKNRNN